MASIKDAIRDWWATSPMTYAEEHGGTDYVDAEGNRVSVDLGSRAFFERADATFYQWNTPHHGPSGPFSKLFDFPRYAGKPVLEVGCGMGCMASNWAKHGACMSAVDLNPVAVEQTRQRFAAFELDGTIRQADGENLPFEDNSFDYAYSWGVLHHSPDPVRSIAELRRVVKPGAEVGIMLYHRNSLLFQYLVRWVDGFLNMESRFLDEIQLASRYGDGARQEGNPHTWPVTRREIHQTLFAGYDDVRVDVFGTDVPGHLDHLVPGLGTRVMPKSWVDALSRRWGWSLWIRGRKPRA